MMDRRAVLLIGLAAVTPLSSVGAQGPAQIEDSCGPLFLHEDSASAATRLCNAIYDQVGEPTNNGARFNYETRICGGASVQLLRDPPSHIARKIQHWWLKNSDALTCDQLGFSVKGGSILKLAVERDSNHFINDVVRRWGLWLNGRDFTGQTILDFIDSEMVRTQGTPYENVMRRYRTLFQRFGAKRAAELTPADQPIDPFEVEIRPLLRTWDRACYFNEGRAAVKRGGLWGYVDTQGQVIVPPCYDGAFAFSQGRAAVHRGGRWGYIDLTGREVIRLHFADARVFQGDGFAEVTTDGRTWTRINQEGQ
jgi:hypothetical protein